MPAPSLLDVGRVAKPHGLRGEVVVEPWSDLPERLAILQERCSETAAAVAGRYFRHTRAVEWSA